jgi:hypothetical protein
MSGIRSGDPFSAMSPSKPDKTVFERPAGAALNGLATHIAILNAHGLIIATNKAWRVFAEVNGPIRGNVLEGVTYLEVCDQARS